MSESARPTCLRLCLGDANPQSATGDQKTRQTQRQHRAHSAPLRRAPAHLIYPAETFLFCWQHPRPEQPPWLHTEGQSSVTSRAGEFCQRKNPCSYPYSRALPGVTGLGQVGRKRCVPVFQDAREAQGLRLPFRQDFPSHRGGKPDKAGVKPPSPPPTLLLSLSRDGSQRGSLGLSPTQRRAQAAGPTQKSHLLWGRVGQGPSAAHSAGRGLFTPTVLGTRHGN